MTSAVELRDAARHYLMGDEIVKALDGVSFSVAAGERVAVMGPSGS